MRLELTDFIDRVYSHLEIIKATQDSLQLLTDIFAFGEQDWSINCEDAIMCLTKFFKHISAFHSFIKRSDCLPLSVISYRFPLIMALTDVNLQITNLNHLLAKVRNESWTALYLPFEQLKEITNEIKILQVQNEEILDHGKILLDRVRFKEREFSTA